MPAATARQKNDDSCGRDKRADWTSYQKSFNKVLSFVVMCASEDFLHLMTAMYEIISVCMCVKQTDNYTICNYIRLL